MKLIMEAQHIHDEVKIKLISAIGSGTEDTTEFDQKARYAELLLKEEDIASNERIANAQMQQKNKASE